MSKKPTGALLPTFESLAADPVTPLYLQVYIRIRDAILVGSLAPGVRLPSSRTLAADLAVSRNTIEVAFDQLETEGFLVRSVGSGSYVAPALPEPDRPPHKIFSADKPTVIKRGKEPLSKRGLMIANAAVQADPTTARAFALCLPSLDNFPFHTWNQLITRRSRQTKPEMLLNGESAGYRPLREAVAAYLNTARGVRCGWEQVIILSSIQQALDMTARLLLDPDDSVWIEEPGYLGARAAFQGAGANLIPVPVDENGLNVGASMAKTAMARLVYVTPSHQYPVGSTLSLTRRLALLDWAANTNAWIFEDDYDSEFRYMGHPLAAMQGLDKNERVLYAGTFNKVLFPALRLAYVVVPRDLIHSFIAARTIFDGYPPGFTQAVLADFIMAGHFTTHIRRMRALYQERHETLMAAASKHLSDKLRFEPSHTGLHVTGWLTKGINDVEISERAEQAGLDVPPISRYYLGRPARAGLILHYATVPPKNIGQGIRTLASVLENKFLLT